jgi:HK97 family phage major capsid protein
MDFNKITTLQEERAAHVKRMRDILDTVDAESRDMNAEESQEYTRLEADVDSKGALITRSQKLASTERELGEIDNTQIEGRALQSGNGLDNAAADAETLRAKYTETFDRYLRYGVGSLEVEERQMLMRGHVREQESRDQVKSTTTAGGFLVPTGFQKELVTHLVQAGTMRQTRSTTIVTETGESLQVPKTTAHGAANWVNEAATISATDETFGQVTLGAYKAIRLIKVSIELLQDNAVDLEGYLSRELGRAIGALENTAYVAGTGASQPQGLVGVASSGKVGLAGQTVSLISDDLIDLFYSVAPGYRRSGEFQTADGTLKAIRKLKDTTGNYLWSPGFGGNGVLANAAPDTILGRPVWDDPDVPVMAANAKSILFGDFSAYWIRDVGVTGPLAGEKGVGAFFVRRLDERFADTGEVGFLAWHRTDGNLIDTTGAVKYYANSAT